MTIQEIQDSWNEFNNSEKAQLLQMLTASITNHFQGIEKNPKVAGGSACIVRTRVPVWTLELLRQNGLSEAQILTDFPTLHAIDLVNAWLYVSSNNEEIQKEIKENQEA
ncbi:MAG: DUF433 domain-containing protein [Spirochaetota bacterium]